jgi:hypothetical protein
MFSDLTLRSEVYKSGYWVASSWEDVFSPFLWMAWGEASYWVIQTA